MRSPTRAKDHLVFVFFFLILGLSGCNNPVTPKEFKAWVTNPDNGLHVLKTSHGFVFDIQFKPSAWIAMERDGGEVEADQNNLQYYVLRIRSENSGVDFIKHGISDAAEFQQRLYYYSYLFQNDIFVEENGERFPCVLYHFENTDISGARTFTLGFESSSKVSKTSSIVIDSQQFSSLPIKIEISKENIPAVKV